MHIKSGTERADGNVFWAYKLIKKGGKDKKELWITKTQYRKWTITRKNYVKKRYKEYIEKQKSLPVEQRNYVGKYNPETGLYFVFATNIGKEIWGTIDNIKHRSAKNRKARKKYFQKCKELPLSTFVVGDEHPEDKNLVIYRFFSNKPAFCKKEEFEEKSKAIHTRYKKYKQKNKDIIKAKVKEKFQLVMKFFKENPHLKRRRGDRDYIIDKYFWGYSQIGSEIWMTKENFEKKKSNANKARNLLRKNQREVAINGK